MMPSSRLPLTLHASLKAHVIRDHHQDINTEVPYHRFVIPPRQAPCIPHRNHGKQRSLFLIPPSHIIIIMRVSFTTLLILIAGSIVPSLAAPIPIRREVATATHVTGMTTSEAVYVFSSHLPTLTRSTELLMACFLLL